MLVASKKKVNELVFPTVDYQNEAKDHKGEDKKVVSKVGFFEVEKKYIKKNDGKGKIVYGGALKEHLIETEDENFFKRVPYNGKTLMISVENSRYSIIHREANEEDKIKFKEAYALHLEHKAKEDARTQEIKDMQAKLAALESEKTEKAKKSKEIKDKE